jgi:glutamate synthase (NADPH/NADH) small chain
MPNTPRTPGIAKQRLSPVQLAAQLEGSLPVLSAHEARTQAARCLGCHDAPCVAATPLRTDLPLALRQIAQNVPIAAARTLSEAGPLAGIAADLGVFDRDEEQACVLGAGTLPIGALKRYALAQAAMVGRARRARKTGKTIAVIGAGAAGLTVAHHLMQLGHGVALFDRGDQPGGMLMSGAGGDCLDMDQARAAIDRILGRDEMSVHFGCDFGRDITLPELQSEYGAVVLAIGLQQARILAGQEAPDFLIEADPAMTFLRDLRRAESPGDIAIGRSVVVIGGGAVAVDIARQARNLGAENVTLAYRRGRSDMGAPELAVERALQQGVHFLNHVQPLEYSGLLKPDSILLERTDVIEGMVRGSGESFRIPADQVFLAIGQDLGPVPEEIYVEGGQIAVSKSGLTSVAQVWAAGACAKGGEGRLPQTLAQARGVAVAVDRSLKGGRG